MDVIGETLDAHMAKFFETDGAGEELPRKVLSLDSFMVPIATFARRKADTVMEEKKYGSPMC